MADAPMMVKVKPLVWQPAPHGYPYDWQAWCGLMGGYYLATSEGAKREHEAVRAARILAALDLMPDPRVAALVQAAREVLRRSDRDHDAWRRLRAALIAVEGHDGAERGQP